VATESDTLVTVAENFQAPEARHAELVTEQLRLAKAIVAKFQIAINISPPLIHPIITKLSSPPKSPLSVVADSVDQ